MKCLKRLISAGVATCAIMAISIPTLASSTMVERFYVYLNGGSVVSSNSARKEYYGDMRTGTIQRPGSNIEWVQGVETVNLRGRSSDGSTGVTVLGQIRYACDYNLSYKPGYGVMYRYYKLAVQYDSDNPYQKLDLQCVWRP